MPGSGWQLNQPSVLWLACQSVDQHRFDQPLHLDHGRFHLGVPQLRPELQEGPGFVCIAGPALEAPEYPDVQVVNALPVKVQDSALELRPGEPDGEGWQGCVGLEQALHAAQLLIGRGRGRNVAAHPFGHREGGAVVMRIGHAQAG